MDHITEAVVKFKQTSENKYLKNLLNVLKPRLREMVRGSTNDTVERENLVDYCISYILPYCIERFDEKLEFSFRTIFYKLCLRRIRQCFVRRSIAENQLNIKLLSSQEGSTTIVKEICEKDFIEVARARIKRRGKNHLLPILMSIFEGCSVGEALKRRNVTKQYKRKKVINELRKILPWGFLHAQL